MPSFNSGISGSLGAGAAALEVETAGWAETDDDAATMAATVAKATEYEKK